ncbi:DUF1178 family protein [Sphingomonas dokdonensis]|uniref:Uncharacterized protein n=1 Tax=Sphingomonas dokdonensis TaxID=344880 RepID=A0A245ZHS6_9SPHN|nr:DUF1178 family protein [Sphingomonas dokdonensis]OWK29283.1 hypothetical protein SPDO_22670 [Sphingomonas dokdonensis]
MIVFDLRCSQGHVFEAWFASSAAYEDQRDRSLVSCPLCADTKVEKAVMAPNVAPKGNAGPASTPIAMKEMLRALANAQQRALEGSRWVGQSFATEARAMHLGEQEQAPIHGQATVEEAKALIDEGVSVAPLLLPVLPPEQAN